MLAVAGLLVALAALIAMALRGVNIMIASLASSLIVIVSNDLEITRALSQDFALGPLGAFTFAGRFFLLFLTGAVFGALMEEGKAASATAQALVRLLGGQRSLWVITLTCALLTYGGVVVFVVIFAIYPLGLELIHRAGIPKRLMLGAVALGAGTFTMTALPGTPSIHNVIAASALGTDLWAGPVLGLVGAALMLAGGMFYLERQRVRYMRAAAGTTRDLKAAEKLPHWLVSVLPMAAVLLTILAPKLVGPPPGSEPTGWPERIAVFAAGQPILWPSFALTLGGLLGLLLLPRLRGRALQVVGKGADSAIMPLLNTSVVIGFGGVVTTTEGFKWFASAMLDSSLPPLLSMAVAINIVAGIVGSASGGLQIFMQTMSQAYVESGIPVEVLHRISVMAAGGLDSLPHCGAVIAMLSIMGMTHRKAYKDVAMVTIVVPILATLAAIALALAGYG
jgi:H+/gluconate symporter-like permease